MKKYMLSIFILLFVSSQVWASGLIFASGSSADDDYSDIIFWANGEGTWNAGTSYTLGSSEYTALDTIDTVCSINSGFIEETGSPLVGNSSFKVAGAWDYCTFTTTAMTLPKGSMGMDVSVTSHVLNTNVARLDKNTPSNAIIANMYTSNRLSGYYKEDGTSFDTLTTTTDFDTVQHFFQVSWDTTVGDGSDYVKVYVDGSLETTTGSKTLGTMALDAFVLGNNSTNAGVVIFDQVMISTDPDRDLNALKALTVAPNVSCPSCPYDLEETFEASEYDNGACGSAPCVTEEAGSPNGDYSTAGIDMVGTYCLHLDHTDRVKFKHTAADQTYVYHKFKFRYSDADTAGGILRITDASDTILGYVSIDPADDKFYAYAGAAGTKTTATLAVNTSMWVKVRAKEGTSNDTEICVSPYDSGWETWRCRSDGSVYGDIAFIQFTNGQDEESEDYMIDALQTFVGAADPFTGAP